MAVPVETGCSSRGAASARHHARERDVGRSAAERSQPNLLDHLLNGLKRRRRHLEDSLNRRQMAHTLSLARHRLHHGIFQAISRHAGGRCLDAGSGHSPYKRLLESKCSSVISIDIEDRVGAVDLIADIQALDAFDDQSFDTVLCSQVLEHVPRPWEAVAEIGRVLRPGGCLILTVPHLSIIHETPHDYFRYTRYGLAALCQNSGLEVETLRPTGGLLCFLGHSVSGLWMSTVGVIPALHWFAWCLNYLLLVRLAGLADRALGFKSLYPCDYLLVARKTVSESAAGQVKEAE